MEPSLSKRYRQLFDVDSIDSAAHSFLELENDRKGT